MQPSCLPPQIVRLLTKCICDLQRNSRKLRLSYEQLSTITSIVRDKSIYITDASVTLYML